MRLVRALQTQLTLTIPTGYPTAMGGGIPVGRMTKMVGRPTAGMTALIYELVVQAQVVGEYVLWIDQPGTFDPVAVDQPCIVLERVVLLWLAAWSGFASNSKVRNRHQIGSSPTIIYQ